MEVLASILALFVFRYWWLCNVQFCLYAPRGKELSVFICLYNAILTYGAIEVINNNNL